MKTGPDLGMFGSKDVGLLSDIIQSAYSDTLSTHTWTGILDLFRQLVLYDSAGAIFANVQTGRLENKIYHDVSPEFNRWYDEHYSGIMVIANAAQTRALTVWRPADVIGKKAWKACEIRNSLFSDFGLNAPICMTCGTASQISARFWFIRESSKSDYDDREVRILKLLQPHFCEALCLAKLVLEGNSYREAFKQTVRPAFICDSSGMIMDMNAAARQLAKGSEGESAEILSQVEAIAQSMISKQVDFEIALAVGTKCRFSLSAVETPNAPTSYVLVVDSPEYLRSGLCTSMQNYGLSEREAEVCMMVIQGMHNREIADTLFIAESTVKDHMTSIFEKLEVASRSAVISKLLGF